MVSCRGRDRARGGRRGVLAAPAVAVRGRHRPGSVPQIRREARIVQPPAVEPGGELAEAYTRRVCAEADRVMSAAAAAAPVRCVAESAPAGPLRAGASCMIDGIIGRVRVGSPFCPMPPASPLTPRHVP